MIEEVIELNEEESPYLPELPESIDIENQVDRKHEILKTGNIENMKY